MRHIDVVIIGGGPAGISAAIWCQRLGIQHLLIEKKGELGGQLLNIHNEIIDYPGVQAANGRELQRMLLTHFHEAGCSVQLNTWISSINNTSHTLVLHEGNKKEKLHYHYLILATGAGQRRLNVPGEKEMLARGENYSASADAHLFKDKAVAIVGGGDRAFEGAILLADAGANVFIVHRSKEFKARSQYLNEALQKENITILTETAVSAILGEKAVSAIELKKKSGEIMKLEVAAVFVRIGVKPNSELAEGIARMNKDGLLETDLLGRTSDPALFAIGDLCTIPLFSSIALSVGQGAVVAKHLASILSEGGERVQVR
ncbi:NAD(P)/FAD-dependent oxidoreductase [Heyndrickxia acidicola]|uniref:FAD-dependent oxidoreductase n=1 Tax=Heyndrickxia acidicola TaxID=209389 RepID=A0ABU6MHY6_9BACI|nr:FAD-dependent oxidoreductase [Heyndrickxia acidicola]MED1204125.1 FAD-dependent oxidoreductase [Heyndrickxia acidicola]